MNCHYSPNQPLNSFQQLAEEEEIEFQLHLAPEEDFVHHHENVVESPKIRNYLSEKEYQQRFSMGADTKAAIERYAEENGFQLDRIDEGSRTAYLKGKAAQINQAFGVQMGNYTDLDPEFGYQKAQSYVGALHLPEDLQGKVQSVSGLNVQPNKEKRVKQVAARNLQTVSPTEKVGYWPARVGEAYNFPEGDGTGECIGLIELGGTYQQSDIDGYFEALGIPSPEIVTVGNKPDNDSLINNLEVTSDIQVAGALVPKAKIVIYYANSNLEAIKLALADKKNRPSVISTSWAGSEFSYSQGELNALYQVCYEASLKGISIVAASGDHGAYNKGIAPPSITFPNVNVPASIFYVMGCGGTTLTLEQTQIESEVVWNETIAGQQVQSGGGFSNKFYAPQYQQQAQSHYFQYYPNLRNNARGVPDVSANASEANGYTILFMGHWTKVGGSSLSTPVWGALIIRLNQALGYRSGFLNKELYQQAGTESFRQILQGNNGYYNALVYWNPCTGLGSPDGKEILSKLK